MRGWAAARQRPLHSLEPSVPLCKRGGSPPSRNIDASHTLALNEPTADGVLLVYLCTIVSILGLFAFVFWRTMQPAALESAPLQAAFHRVVPGFVLTTYDRSEAEELAVQTAKEENRKQQLEGLALEARQTDAPAERKAAPPPVKQSPKPRHVARTQVVRTRAHDARPFDDPRQSWAAAWGRDLWGRNRTSYDRSERGRNDRAWHW